VLVEAVEAVPQLHCRLVCHIILQLRPSRSWWSSMCSSLLWIGLVNRSHITEFSLQKFKQIEALGTNRQKYNKYDNLDIIVIRVVEFHSKAGEIYRFF